MMHNCTRACGKTVSMAAGKPFNPSTQAMKMSRTPRLFNSVSICNHNERALGLTEPDA
jgi:hypothetical protein